MSLTVLWLFILSGCSFYFSAGINAFIKRNSIRSTLGFHCSSWIFCALLWHNLVFLQCQNSFLLLLLIKKLAFFTLHKVNSCILYISVLDEALYSLLFIPQICLYLFNFKCLLEDANACMYWKVNQLSLYNFDNTIQI